MYEIKYIDRKSNQTMTENVYGDALINFFYKNNIGKNLTKFLISPPVSKAVGFYHNMSLSAKKIPQFIQDYQIEIDDYEKGSLSTENINHSYANFNEFFIRKFKQGKRAYPTKVNEMGAPAEARYFAFDEINEKTNFPVKGEFLNPRKIIGDSRFAKEFNQGPLLIARLCPVDYHRYHYFDDGVTLDSFPVSGKYHSVNPLALHSYPNIFIENEKRVSILETNNFGLIAYIEVGAMCVGKIVQSAPEDEPHTRGAEKGYFLFGASTVILIGQKNKLHIDDDLLTNSLNNKETYCQLGEKIAQA